MRSIDFNTGLKPYIINGDENNIIKINLSDLNIMKRIECILSKLEEMQERYKEIDKLTTQQLSELDSEIRRQIDYAFDTDICSHAFGDMNVLSPINGKPLFMVFFEAFIPILKDDLKSVQPILRPEVQKYIKDENNEKYDSEIDIDSMTKEQKNALLEKLLS